MHVNPFYSSDSVLPSTWNMLYSNYIVAIVEFVFVVVKNIICVHDVLCVALGATSDATLNMAHTPWFTQNFFHWKIFLNSCVWYDLRKPKFGYRTNENLLKIHTRKGWKKAMKDRTGEEERKGEKKRERDEAREGERNGIGTGTG